MIVKTDKENESLLTGGKILGEILDYLIGTVAPGITTRELDHIAEKKIRDAGGKPSFLGYASKGDRTPFPATICVSINEEVVHGIPGKRKLKEGDIIGIDIGMEYEEFFTDTAVTIPIGKVSPEIQNLLEVTKQSLEAGINAAVVNATTGDIGHAIESYVRPHKYGIVRELVGHGVGRAVHEDPQIPNYGKQGRGEYLPNGSVIALEPMFILGDRRVRLASDGWTWVSADGSFAAHFEHSLIITFPGPVVLTRRPSELKK